MRLLSPARTVLVFVVAGPPIALAAAHVYGAWIRYRLSSVRFAQFDHPLEAVTAGYGNALALLGAYLAGAPTAFLAAVLFLLCFRVTRAGRLTLYQSIAASGLLGALAGGLSSIGLIVTLGWLLRRPPSPSSLLLLAPVGAAAGAVAAVLSVVLAAKKHVA